MTQIDGPNGNRLRLPRQPRTNHCQALALGAASRSNSDLLGCEHGVLKCAGAQRETTHVPTWAVRHRISTSPVAKMSTFAGYILAAACAGENWLSEGCS
jgi:hypothetical protein